jgi:hypothetical protein
MTVSKYINNGIDLYNTLKLNYNTIIFNKNNISQSNNQIIFNNTSHLDTGMQIINNLSTLTVSFKNPYPTNYTPTVILQQYNSLNIMPLLVTNITNFIHYFSFFMYRM